MEFTLQFVRLFLSGLELTAPILLFLVLIIVALGQLAGKRESWSRGDALYWTFITATTVGYGDFRPLARASRILAVLIALCGLIFTGIIVAVAITATTSSIQRHYDDAELRQMIERFDD
ncbi:MAG: potassium channel family protein [Gammaproteobacteria bacterium]|jgi:voltage-gated potassium channel